jgi:hypothetical protein
MTDFAKHGSVHEDIGEPKRVDKAKFRKNKMTDLKKCPFCGSNGKPEFKSSKSMFIKCSNKECFISHHLYEIDQWNNRPIEQEQAQKLKAIKGKIEEIRKGMNESGTFNDNPMYYHGSIDTVSELETFIESSEAKNGEF